MNRLNQILTRMGEVRGELLTLADVETPTDEQSARFVELETEFDTLETERAPLAARAAKVESIRTAALDPVNVTPGSGATGPTVIVRTTRDPFDSTRAVMAGALEADDLRGRALDAIEAATRSGAQFHLGDAGAEKVTRLIENEDDGGVARHVLLTGSDSYHRSFRKLMKNQGEVNSLEPDEQASVRAALSLTGANGGFLIPVTLDPTIILTNSGSANPFRQISQVKTITTNFWEGVTSAGVNAAWLAEAGVVTDNTPTIAQPVITPQKAAAWVFGSYEVLGDSDFASQFPALLVDAKDRLEEAAFATGAGTGGVPKGIVTAATTAVTTAAVATYAIADVYALQAAIPPRFRINKSSLAIVANVGIINKTRQFDTAGGSSYWTNLGASQPERVLGIPLYESTTMVSTTTTGSKIAVAGDFSQYAIVDRVGMTVAYEPMVKDSATARPTGQAGWFAYWRVGADALVPGAFRTLTVQ
jgi:HK97 family phage major capsid protein